MAEYAPMRRLPALLLIICLAGCKSPDSIIVHMSKAEIQSRLAARFPVEKRELFYKATFTDPAVVLDGNGNEIGLDVTSRLEVTRDIVLGGRVSLQGAVDYDPASGALLIRKIHILRTHLDTVPAGIAPVLDRFGGLPAVDRLFGEACKRLPPHISDLKIGQVPKDWRGDIAKSVIRSVRVVPDGLDVEIGLPR